MYSQSFFHYLSDFQIFFVLGITFIDAKRAFTKFIINFIFIQMVTNYNILCGIPEIKMPVTRSLLSEEHTNESGTLIASEQLWDFQK